MKFNFLGPSNPLQPSNVSVERTVNFYDEATAPGTPRVPLTNLYTPGRFFAATVTGDAIRTLALVFSTLGMPRVFGLSTNTFFEITPSGSGIAITEWGTVAVSTGVGQGYSLATNGQFGDQVFIVSGGNGYLFTMSTNTFAAITDPDFPTGTAGWGVYLDGYFIVNNIANNSFQLSALEDGTLWDPLDVAQRSNAPDAVTAIAVFRNELWLFGSQSTEVWYDSGFALFPFQPVQGGLMQIGVTYPSTIVVLDNALWFAGMESIQGSTLVYRAVDYSPRPISTVAVVEAIGATDFNLDQLRAWSYADNQHRFYLLRLPSNASWCYDEQTGLWQERAIFREEDAGGNFLWDPDPMACHVTAFGMNIVGSAEAGELYLQSLSYLEDTIPV